MSGQDLNHAIHLRPVGNDGHTILKINLRQMRVRFTEGRKFTDGFGNIVTIHDIPADTNVTLRNRKQQKLHLRVIPVA